MNAQAIKELESILSASPRDKKMFRQLVEAVVTSLVTRGLIDAKGKSKVQILSEAQALLDGVELNFITDHRPDLLKHARKAKRCGKYEVASIFYATWFEHQINGTLDILLERKEISKQDIDILIRGCNLECKARVLLPLLGFPKFDSRHLNALKRISEHRNAFVHYKFSQDRDDIDLRSERRKALEADFNKADQGCIYLQKVVTRFFTAGQSRKVKKMMRD